MNAHPKTGAVPTNMKDPQSMRLATEKESNNAAEFTRELVITARVARQKLPKETFLRIEFDDGFRPIYVISILPQGATLIIEGFDSEGRQCAVFVHYLAARFRMIVEEKSADQPEMGFHTLFPDYGQPHITRYG